METCFPLPEQPLRWPVVPTALWVTEPLTENGPTVAFGRGLLGVEQLCPLEVTGCWPVIPIGW